MLGRRVARETVMRRMSSISSSIHCPNRRARPHCRAGDGQFTADLIECLGEVQIENRCDSSAEWCTERIQEKNATILVPYFAISAEHPPTRRREQFPQSDTSVTVLNVVSNPLRTACLAPFRCVGRCDRVQSSRETNWQARRRSGLLLSLIPLRVTDDP